MMNTPWHIQLLGGLRCHSDDRLIARFRSYRTGALLAYLAFYRDRPHPREELIELFWPESDPAAARLSLRVALSSLRRQLEPPGLPPGSVIIADYATVQLHPTAVTTDVSVFESRLAAAACANSRQAIPLLRAATNAYGGELLPGYYEAWILVERERLAGAYVAGLKRLSALLEEAGDLDGALEAAHRAVAADSFCEESRYRLMQLYVAARRPADALSQYTALAEMLRTELGEEPSPEVRAFAESLHSEGKPVCPGRRFRPSQSKRGGRSTSADSGIASTNLPGDRPKPGLPLTFHRFFGREKERDHLHDLLLAAARQDPETPRLITLTGPGGSGKTRLAIEATARAQQDFDGAVWFVSLADLTDSVRIPNAIAVALGILERADVPLFEQILTALTSQPALLVLDNYEHLLASDRAEFSEATAVVSALLAQAPALTCLVTSRQRLGLPGESELPLRPLPVPEEGIPAEEIGKLACVRLFVDRAQRVRPDFGITPRNAATIAALCARLEGLPLAIELAAAWSRALTPAQMLERLSDRFALLVSRDRPVTARHRTLWATLEWSYHLLSPALQRFFVRLSVFQGGWTLAATQEVCAASEALTLLADLCDRSLVITEECGSVMRYRLLETVREFAQQKVAETEWPELMQRHASYYVQFVEEAEPGLLGAAQRQWTRRLDADYANIRAALAFYEGCETGLRMAAALVSYWQVRGYLVEGSDWLDRMLAAQNHAPSWLRAKALCGAFALAHFLGDLVRATTLWEEGSALLSSLEDRRAASQALQPLVNPDLFGNLGIFKEAPAFLEFLHPYEDVKAISAFRLACEGRLAQIRGDYAAAGALHAQSLALYRELGDSRGIAILLRLRGEIAIYQGNYAAVRRRWEESLRLYRQLGDQTGIATMVGNLGYLACRMADFPRAEQLTKEALALNRRMGRSGGVADNLWLLACVLSWRGNYEEAVALLEESLALRRRLGDSGIADTLSTLGRIAQCRGDLGAARAWHQEALELRRQGEDRQDIAFSLIGMGEVARLEEDYTQATALFREALTLSREMESTYGMAASLRGLGRTACRQGDAVEAEKLLRESLALYSKLEDKAAIAECLEGLAGVRYLQNDLQAAATLYGAAQALREALGAPLPPVSRLEVDRNVSALGAALGKEPFVAAWSRGRALTLAEASADSIHEG